MKRLAIYGASGHGKVVADCAVASGWGEVEFFDDKWPDLEVSGRWRVTGNLETLIQKMSSCDGVIVAIGDNKIRMEKIAYLESVNMPLVSLIHPSAVISQYAEIGVGAVIFAGAVINVDTRIGKGVIINTGATIDHDCDVDEGSHVSPGANLAGGVLVGKSCWIGIGASVKQGIEIADGVTVGAGAAVVSDINTPDITVVGVPAAPMSV